MPNPSREGERLACPKCGEPIAVDAVVQAVAGQSLTFRVQPSGKNGVLNLRNFGKLVEQFGKFTEALSHDAGLNEKAFLSGLKFTKDGVVEVTALLARLESKSSSTLPTGERD